MSKNVNVGLLFRELGINKSEAFRDEVSRAFSANIMPKVEQILDDRGITDRRDKTTFVRRYSQAILDTLDQQLGMIFHEVSQTILPRIVGDTDVADGDIVFSQGEEELIRRLEAGGVVSGVLQKRNDLLQALAILRPLGATAKFFFSSNTHSIVADFQSHSNFISPFGIFFSEKLDLTRTDINSSDDGGDQTYPTNQLEENEGDLFDLIYNKVLLEWFEGKYLGSKFRHSLNLIDEPTLKKGKKGETREGIFFLPIDIFLLHVVVSFLSRGVFDFSNEEDIENAARELDEVDDIENFALVLEDQMLGYMIPYISQISSKKPFLEWIRSKTNSKEIKRILLLIKNHKKNRKKTSMKNIYWLLGVDKEMQVKKATFTNFC